MHHNSFTTSPRDSSVSTSSATPVDILLSLPSFLSNPATPPGRSVLSSRPVYCRTSFLIRLVRYKLLLNCFFFLSPLLFLLFPPPFLTSGDCAVYAFSFFGVGEVTLKKSLPASWPPDPWQVGFSFSCFFWPLPFFPLPPPFCKPYRCGGGVWFFWGYASPNYPFLFFIPLGLIFFPFLSSPNPILRPFIR